VDAGAAAERAVDIVGSLVVGHQTGALALAGNPRP
jgi:hypothetical protein